MTLFQSELNKRSNELAKPMKSNYELIMWQRWSSVVVHAILVCVCSGVCVCVFYRAQLCFGFISQSFFTALIYHAGIYYIGTLAIRPNCLQLCVCGCESVCARAQE